MRLLTVLAAFACVGGVVATSGRAVKSRPASTLAVSHGPIQNAAADDSASRASDAGSRSGHRPETTFDDVVRRNGERMIEEGQQIFRFDTFGDEAFWGDTLKLHRAIEGERFGGVGPGVSPASALAVGLKVDAEALPSDVVNAIRHRRVNLNDPAVTLALLEANAVVGVTGHPGNDGGLASVGIQCSLCHSTVDSSA